LQARQATVGHSQERAACSSAQASTAPDTASAKLPDWPRVLAALRMTDRQLHYLKLLRDRHLERLRALLGARQTLSLEVRPRVWERQDSKHNHTGILEPTRGCVLLLFVCNLWRFAQRLKLSMANDIEVFEGDCGLRVHLWLFGSDWTLR